MACLNSS